MFVHFWYSFQLKSHYNFTFLVVFRKRYEPYTNMAHTKTQRCCFSNQSVKDKGVLNNTYTGTVHGIVTLTINDYGAQIIDGNK